jgi:glycine/D-amino acid oxidase-like deaminating enzyme
VAKTADVVVIGGGAVGTSIAYFLAKKNMDVVLIEKGGIATGTSGGCDGNVMLNDTMPGYDCRLKKMSQDLFPVLANELDFDIGWSQRGSVLVIESERFVVQTKLLGIGRQTTILIPYAIANIHIHRAIVVYARASIGAFVPGRWP